MHACRTAFCMSLPSYLDSLILWLLRMLGIFASHDVLISSGSCCYLAGEMGARCGQWPSCWHLQARIVQSDCAVGQLLQQ